METRQIVVRMLRQLLEEMLVLHQQGAGYFSCVPLAKRYNKLLGQARGMAASAGGLMDTFDDIPEEDPKEPSEKMKIVQGIRVEIGQLISLLESIDGDKA